MISEHASWLISYCTSADLLVVSAAIVVCSCACSCEFVTSGPAGMRMMK